MKRFACPACAAEVFFGNLDCLSCGAALGIAPAAQEVVAWPLAERLCANRGLIGCNWLLAQGTAPGGLCPSCVLTRTTPPEGDLRGRALWSDSELAKRRLLHGLIRLGLPHPAKAVAGRDGLAFDFLMGADRRGNPIRTGHTEGLITLNLAEADETQRMLNRSGLDESYRTLIGHMRHEVGHYYWNQLVRRPGLYDAFRAAFGDERQDYANSLARHYQIGPPPDWQARHISAYASSHPWEDWAETWAHWLHILDALDTARALGLQLADAPQGYGLDPYQEVDTTRLIDAFVPLAIAGNALNRALGQPDLYPFVLSPPVAAKIALIAGLVHGTA